MHVWNGKLLVLMNFGGKIPGFEGKRFEFGKIIGMKALGKLGNFWFFKEKSLGLGKVFGFGGGNPRF